MAHTIQVRRGLRSRRGGPRALESGPRSRGAGAHGRGDLEHHQVRAVLLNQGAIHEAALAAIETLEVYLGDGRDLQVPPLTATLADCFVRHARR